MANPKTASDLLFDTYLDACAMPWECEPDVPGKTTHPDYRVRFQGQELFFDVKGFDAEAHQPPMGFSTFDPYSPIRAKIDDARPQFKQFKEYGCSLVLHNGEAFVQLEDPKIIFGAMLGNVGFLSRIGPDVSATDQIIINVFTSGGKILCGTEERNTTFAAIIVLQKFPLAWRRYQVRRPKVERDLGRRLTCEEELSLLESCHAEVPSPPTRVMVYENPFARNPLRRDLLGGPFDERYGREDECIVRHHEGRLLRDLRDEAIRNGVQDTWTA